jgi:hypothetical protein
MAARQQPAETLPASPDSIDRSWRRALLLPAPALVEEMGQEQGLLLLRQR